MDIINLKCPNCGGSIQMDETGGNGICLYCGERFLAREEIGSGSFQNSRDVEPGRNSEIDNLRIGSKEDANSLTAIEKENREKKIDREFAIGCGAFFLVLVVVLVIIVALLS